MEDVEAVTASTSLASLPESAALLKLENPGEHNAAPANQFAWAQHGNHRPCCSGGDWVQTDKGQQTFGQRRISQYTLFSSGLHQFFGLLFCSGSGTHTLALPVNTRQNLLLLSTCSFPHQL